MQQISHVPTQAELMNTFAQFTDEKRMQRTFAPNPYQLPKTVKQLKKDKFERKYGMLYTGAAIVAGVGIAGALLRGGKIFDLAKFLKNKYTRALGKASKNENVAIARANTTRWGAKVWKKLSEWFNVIANLNPLKDITIAKGCEKVGLKPVFNKITKFLTRQGRKLTRSQYNAPMRDLDDMKSVVKKVIVRLKNNNPNNQNNQLIENLEKLLQSSTEEMNKIVNGFDGRFDDTVKTLDNLAQNRFINEVKPNGKMSFGTLTKKINEMGEFLPEKLMAGEKTRIYSDLFTSRRTLSNSILDLGKTVDKGLDNIFFNAALDNSQTRKTYYNLKELLEQVRNPKTANARRAVLKGELLDKLGEAKTLGNLTDAQKTALDDLAQIIRNDKKGAVEEMVSLAKAIKESDPNLYQELVQRRNKFQRSLGKAVEFETEKNYGRLLDFSLEAVPSDVLTQVLGIGSIAYISMDRKKSKEEKISANLKAGIPLLGGMAISVLCNLRQVACGANAILLGLVSTLILNRLGNSADKQYQKYLLNKTA